VDLGLTGRRAVVTGGSKGLGKAIAAELLAEGAAVVICSRNQAELDKTAAELAAAGGTVTALPCDVTDPGQVGSFIPGAAGALGGIDILVNNAGTNPYFGPLIDIDLVRAQKTFEVNQLSVLVWTAAAVKAGLQGSVINVASVGGLEVEPGIGWYNVTKAAVLHLTRQLSFELAPDVRVNALAPGLVKTKLAAALWEGHGEERISAHVPLRRLGVPDDVATAALFLASDASSWVTGATFVVDGGTMAQPSGGVG
jgi:NAD(P)-dependent dehydrogenase (short-subunit alcohol dehydrogenase family)